MRREGDHLQPSSKHGIVAAGVPLTSTCATDSFDQPSEMYESAGASPAASIAWCHALVIEGIEAKGPAVTCDDLPGPRLQHVDAAAGPSPTR